jgi:thioredoxin 1
MIKFITLALLLVSHSFATMDTIHDNQSNAQYMVTHTSTSTFTQDVLQSPGLVLVDFFATWCGPCQRIAPSLNSIQNELGDKIKIVKLDADQNRDTFNHYGVTKFPTLKLFLNGVVIATKVGSDTKDGIMNWISQYLVK